jgi:hypothetical protein
MEITKEKETGENDDTLNLDFRPIRSEIERRLLGDLYYKENYETRFYTEIIKISVITLLGFFVLVFPIIRDFPVDSELSAFKTIVVYIVILSSIFFLLIMDHYFSLLANHNPLMYLLRT